MDDLLRWVDREVSHLPLILTLHSAVFVALLLVAFLSGASRVSFAQTPRWRDLLLWHENQTARKNGGIELRSICSKRSSRAVSSATVARSSSCLMMQHSAP